MKNSKEMKHIQDRLDLLSQIDESGDIIATLSSLMEYIWQGEADYTVGGSQIREFKFKRVNIKVFYE